VVLRVTSLPAGHREKTNTDYSCLFFEVEDTGPGIAPEEIKCLFQDFVQTKTGQNSTEGTGLGLSITRNFGSIIRGKYNS
jgi:signal transduction histidine kinase